MADKIQIRRGTDAQRLAVVFDTGEPVWCTDTSKMYIGDGSTLGGIIVADVSGHESTYDHGAYDTHVGSTSNPHSVTTTQIGAATATSVTNHTNDITNPHSVTAAQVGADTVGSAAAVGALLTSHEGDTTNPHSVTATQIGAIPTSDRNAINGVAGLDGDGKILGSQLPAIAITETFVVANIAARDALVVQTGDVSIVTDAGAGQPNTYIYDGTIWQELAKPADSVTSINGQTGVVVLNDGSIAYTRTDGLKKVIDATSDTVGAAINDLDDAIDAHATSITNPHGVTLAQVGGAAAIDLTNHINDQTNPHAVDASDVGALVSIDGVSNAGGNIDLIQGGAITITPDDVGNTITITETHSALTNNPHGVTAAQVGASATGHGHTAANISDFAAAVDTEVIATFKDAVGGFRSITATGNGNGVVVDGGTIA